MTRLADLEPAALSPDARAVDDDIARDHVRVRGPWQIELRIPEVAHHYHGLYRRLCVNPKVGKRLFELMVIVVARHFTAQFEWYAHERQALANGIAPPIVDAIRHRRVPVFEQADEQLVYDLTRELLESNRVATTTYDRALAAFGEEYLVELIAGAGTYASLAMQLNAFDVTPPADAVLLEGP
jgi:4-carboxymuconolactone decarboxylase